MVSNKPLHPYCSVFLLTSWWHIQYGIQSSQVSGKKMNCGKFSEQRRPSIHSIEQGSQIFILLCPRVSLEVCTHFSLASVYLTWIPVSWTLLEKTWNLEYFFPLQKTDGRVQWMEDFHYSSLQTNSRGMLNEELQKTRCLLSYMQVIGQ